MDVTYMQPWVQDSDRLHKRLAANGNIENAQISVA